jgi:hypothetical protein
MRVYTGMEHEESPIVEIDFYKRFWVVHQP